MSAAATTQPRDERRRTSAVRTVPRHGADLTPAERAALGKAARSAAPRSAHGRGTPARARPGRPARGAGRRPGSRSWCRSATGACSSSPFTFYRGRRAAHGGRPGRRRPTRAHGPAVRRRAPLELRPLRRRPSAPRLRHQRLRRDAPRAVGVGRQAPRGQLRDRGARPRLTPRPRGGRSSALRVAPTARRCGSSPRWRTSSSGTRGSTSTSLEPRRVERRQGREARGVQRRRRARRATKDDLRALTSSPTRSTASRLRSDPPLLVPIEDCCRERRRAAASSTHVLRKRPRLPGDAAARPAAPARPLPRTWTWRARSSASAASARAPGSCCSSAATTATRWSSRPSRRRPSVLEPYVGRSRFRNHGRARGRGPAPDAGGERHLPRLVPRDGVRRRARLLRPPALGRQGLVRRRDDDAGRVATYAETVRLDAGAGARALGRPHRDRRVPRGRRRLRPGVAEFAEQYADQNEHDFALVQGAATDGRVAAQAGVWAPSPDRRRSFTRS